MTAGATTQEIGGAGERPPARERYRWDGRQHCYRPSEGWLERVSPRVRLHRDVDDELDPVTFEVIRNRLWTSNLAHGETLTRISGSPVFQALDFNMCVLTEDAEMVVNAPYIVYLSSGAPLSVPYIMERFGEAPGIDDGDIYLASDPWVGVCHQMDVLLACPVFVDGRIFAWVCNAGHQYDLGGVVPGGWPQNALDIYYDPVLFSPFKIVEQDVLREDLDLMYRRQSRMPDLLALDLRSQIAGCRHGRQEILDVCEEFGAATVKAAMRRILDNTQRTLSERLREIPDGRYHDVSYFAEKMPGDRGTYRTRLNAAKRGDRLVIDNEGTGVQMEGPTGSVYAAWAGWIFGAVAETLTWEHAFSIGGVERQLDLEPTPGLLTCVDYPAAVAGGVVNGALAFSSALRILARMQATVPGQREDVVIQGDAAALILFSGVNDRGQYVGQAVFEPNAAGGGGRADRDGVDMSGSPASPLMHLLNVEEYEQFFPVMYLYRTERTDGAGAGRWRGGTGSDVAYIPYRAQKLEVITNSGGMFNVTHGARGLFGGLPSPTQETLVLKDTRIKELFAQGIVPSGPEQLAARETLKLSGKSNGTPLESEDVLILRFPGGGGYGDPLEREPARVAADVRLGYVSAGAADALYGVVLDARGAADETRSAARRQDLLRERLRWLPADPPPGADRRAAPSTGEPDRSIHEYVVARDDGDERILACSRCGTRLAGYSGNFKLGLLVDDAPLTMIPQVSDPSFFIDDHFVLRRACCPGCGVLMEVDIVRADDPVGDEMVLGA